MVNGCSAPRAKYATLLGRHSIASRQPELGVERLDVPVGGEEVVVVALEPDAAADVQRRRLAAQPRPALVHVDRVPGAREPVRGGQPRHARPEDRDPHRAPAEGARPSSPAGASTFARSRTTYSGRRLTSS